MAKMSILDYLRQPARADINIHAIGRFRVVKMDRESGRKEPTNWAYNTVTEVGKNRFCRQVTGLDSAPLNQANTELVLRNGSNNIIKVIPCSRAVSHSGRFATWDFDDISVDVYTVASVEVRRTGSPAYTFSTASPAFSGGNNKPNSQNWLYEYELELQGGVNFDLQYDGSPPAPGLERMLRCFSGNLSSTWAGLTTRLFVYTEMWDDGNPRPDPAASLEISSGYPQVEDNVITWQYVTTGANVLWRNVEIAQDLTGGPFVLGWIPVNRTKVSPSTWEYTATFTLN